MSNAPRNNIHATALVLGERGVAVFGPSGSGKTTLALTLIREFERSGHFARMIGDDQLFVAAHGGRLVASCPPAIAGLAEVYGIGPWAVPQLGAAVVDLVVRLVETVDAPRFPDPQSEPIAGLIVPRLDLPARNTIAASLAVTAWLKAGLFA